MKIKSTLLVALIILTSVSFGQDMIAQYKGFNGKWGYVNINGKEITKPVYTHCDRFEHGFGRVDGKNFINSKGEKLIVSFEAKEVHNIVEGHIAVKSKGKWGLINLKGELLAPLIYKGIADFNEGKSIGFNSETIDIYNAEEKIVGVALDKGRVSGKGKLAIVRPFHDGISAIAVDLDPRAGVDFRFGFIDETGKLIVEPNYLAVSDFNEGLAWVKNSENKFGFVDKRGRLVTDIRYIKVGNFSEGLAWVRKIDNKFGFIDKEGNEVVKAKYLKVGSFYKGLCWFRSEEGFGFIDNKGNEVVKAKYTKIGKFLNDVALVRDDKGNFGYINEKAEELISPLFLSAGKFDPVSGLARIEYKETKKKKRGYVTMKGEMKFFENTNIFKHFSEGLSPEKTKDKLVGFIDDSGEWAIEPKFKVATGFVNGFSKVKMFVDRKIKWGIINLKGEWVIEPKYMKIYEFYNVN